MAPPEPGGRCWPRRACAGAPGPPQLPPRMRRGRPSGCAARTRPRPGPSVVPGARPVRRGLVGPSAACAGGPSAALPSGAPPVPRAPPSAPEAREAPAAAAAGPGEAGPAVCLAHKGCE